MNRTSVSPWELKRAVVDHRNQWKYLILFMLDHISPFLTDAAFGEEY
ncbi:rCG28245 [Rattus norvegicus]|uniref:RCG28245 n=1 Tax=Rattus norvegicus TaxID=10116 RepID=A6IE17_RAT|nr:rCG28245 [Rattus norvegicus]